ncbi:MAG TPA: serine/threonine-protein kinase [Polyangiaceae bacterium LLY-WYZ-15_(1-7)]|nr:serine/threonine-protein kinase [Polyangiaceae bacterium LLY-WYZ-15_(1-7)]HJL08950.1 serine/threonine-protein kinase [Polyangiaceae bacterium LLY-WYZ-15_(1-7)]
MAEADPEAQPADEAEDAPPAEPPHSADPFAETHVARPTRGGDEDEVPLPAPGDRVGHFVVERELGRGGMGVVFVARDPQLQRQVALKVLRHDRAATHATDAQQRMLREAQAMAMLSHPHLVTIYEVGAWAKSVFLAMEYVTGRTLGAWLEEDPPLEAILTVFGQAGRALQAVHDAGLVHRDFKPDNVLVKEDGTAKLLDLGIARRVIPEDTLEEATEVAERSRGGAATSPETGKTGETSEDGFDTPLTRDGELVGTPAYMAPEQLLAKPIDGAADQFAFAVALHEALTGRRPFPGRNAVEAIANILACNMRPWPEGSEVPTPIREALGRALATDPQERFPSMDALLTELARGLGLRGQLRFLTDRWLQNGRRGEYLLPSGELLSEGVELLDAHPESLTGPQTEFLRASLAAVRRRRLKRRALFGGLGALALGAVPTIWLLQRRTAALEHTLRERVRTQLVAVRGLLADRFERDGDAVRLLFAQRAVWMPHAHALLAASALDRPEPALRAAIGHLNAFFRPLVEQSETICSLMVASDDFEYLAFDDRDARALDPPYRFYNRLVHGSAHGDRAFQLFWSEEGGSPRASWLEPGAPESRGRPWDGYDVASRPWYRLGAAGEDGALRWTRPYLFFVSRDAGITAVLPWRAHGRRWVLGVDFTLTDLSRQTAELNDPEVAALVTTRDGSLVALPRDPRFATLDGIRAFLDPATGPRTDAAPRLPHVEALDRPLLARAFDVAGDAPGEVFSFEHEGTPRWAASGPVGTEGQDLRALIVKL